jgi:hypothetical protein
LWQLWLDVWLPVSTARRRRFLRRWLGRRCGLRRRYVVQRACAAPACGSRDDGIQVNARLSGYTGGLYLLTLAGEETAEAGVHLSLAARGWVTRGVQVRAAAG